MTPASCKTARKALLHGDQFGAAEHVADCPACIAFARRLADVDGTLERDAEIAAGAALPAALRARISEATRRARHPAPSGGVGVIELVLRLAAVAAVLVAGFVALPTELRAGELDLTRLTELEGRVRAVVTEAPELEWPALETPLPRPPVESPWVLAGSAALLLGAGWLTLRTGERNR